MMMMIMIIIEFISYRAAIHNGVPERTFTVFICIFLWMYLISIFTTHFQNMHATKWDLINYFYNFLF